MKVVSTVDRFLNSITMYRLLAFGLGGLLLYALLLAFLGILPFGGMPYVYSAVVLIVSAWATNAICAKIWNVPANAESWTISALILFFILFPVVTATDLWTTLFAGVLAMLSRYIINYNGKHLFNPVAIAAVVLGLAGSGNVTWWAATPMMFPLVALLALLIVRKVRKFQMVSIYLVLALLMNLGTGASLSDSLFSYPIVFFAAIMLTEPLTMPGRKRDQNIYAGVAALLPVTPELSLVIVNFFAFLFGFKQRLRLRLVETKEVAKDIYEFSFAQEQKNKETYLPGQFFDWTFAYAHQDLRGNRRYFTIASSPTEEHIKIGVKIGENGSTFKKALREMKKGTPMVAGTLGGDFVLPKEKETPLVFIAGGIGVTPFRSMIKYLLDTKERRDIILFYTVATEEDIAYRDVFYEAVQELGIRVMYVVTSTMGFITQEMIEKEVGEYKGRTFYLSGPSVMVDSYKALLKKMNVEEKHIKTDYFPGF